MALTSVGTIWEEARRAEDAIARARRVIGDDVEVNARLDELQAEIDAARNGALLECSSVFGESCEDAADRMRRTTANAIEEAARLTESPPAPPEDPLEKPTDEDDPRPPAPPTTEDDAPRTPYASARGPAFIAAVIIGALLGLA